MVIELLTYFSTFIFIFSLLGIIRTIVNFISSLLSDPPKPLNLTNRELLINGLFFSYVITYIISLI